MIFFGKFRGFGSGEKNGCAELNYPGIYTRYCKSLAVHCFMLDSRHTVLIDTYDMNVIPEGRQTL